jgi:nucleotidyltransferase/DNA polymerase involved in DNA repair
VETLRLPQLRHSAVAVAQHQDIIAVNYAARAAGVTKHMLPAEARSLLKSVGGQVCVRKRERECVEHVFESTVLCNSELVGCFNTPPLN